MLLAADQMAYQARALAQSDPFTLLARRSMDRAIEAERKAQPGNFPIWATAAFTKGYCVRRVEEEDTGVTYVAVAPENLPELDEVDERTAEIVTALRTDDDSLHAYLISDEERLLDVLDQVIGSEVRNRIENANANLNSRARAELEDYLTYWVVRGYALRTAELAMGALVKA
ncbi:MAG: hypothetical protein M3144_01825 [Actinomycetota bacterium]|nr:hypothetical protein [Actinomycetota bacterium]